MQPTKQTTPKRKPVPRTKPTLTPSPPMSPPSLPSPSLVRELTRLRFTRQDKDAQLNALRASLVQQSVGQQRVARSFRRRVGRFENDDDIFAESAERARVRSADRLAVDEIQEKCRHAAVELAMVEMEVELVHWRDWLGEGAHGREGCEECERAGVEKEGGRELGLARKRMGSCWRGGERLLSPLNWEKGGGAAGGGLAGVQGKRAGSVEEEDY